MRESRLLEHVARTASRSSAVVVPPGDDLAAVQVPAGAVLLGVGQVVDGVHVDLGRVPVEAAGRKAIARCVSDVAAMAGRPVASLAAVVLPRDFTEERTVRLFDAVRQAADACEAPLVGGDIAVHAGGDGPLVLSVSVLGVPGPAGIIRRDGARPGDLVCVTGRLGGSLEPGGGGRHLSFTPRVAAGLELAERLGSRLHAMMDLSDGLGRDAGRMAAASGVAMRLEAERLPRHEGIDWRGAVGDGEDYELLFTLDGEPPASVAGVDCTVIGRVEAADPAGGWPAGVVRLRLGGAAGPGEDAGAWIDIRESGWEHRDGGGTSGADT